MISKNRVVVLSVIPISRLEPGESISRNPLLDQPARLSRVIGHLAGHDPQIEHFHRKYARGKSKRRGQRASLLWSCAMLLRTRPPLVAISEIRIDDEHAILHEIPLSFFAGEGERVHTAGARKRITMRVENLDDRPATVAISVLMQQLESPEPPPIPRESASDPRAPKETEES